MKFNVFTDGSRTFIRIERGNSYIDYIRASQTDFEASVLCEAVRAAMRNRVENIRREAYLAGWQDAKRKTKKKTRFGGCLNSDYVGH